MRNKAFMLALGVLALGVLACAIQAPNGTPNALGVTKTPPPFPYFATVTSPLTVRSAAGEENEALGYLDPGDTVTVYNLIRAKDGGFWASVDGGYVNSKFLDKIE